MGVAGSLGKNEEDAFRHLLVIDSIRGEDSTGTAYINRANHTTVVKSVGDPYQLFDMKSFQAGLRQTNKCIIGHNRSATIGKIIRKNAHPFDFPSLVGVHNGTLFNKRCLDDAASFDTDSEALYNTIHQRGIKKALDRLSGAWTLVWYNKDRGSINFLRNKERPLYLALSKDEKCLFWASEYWMLSSPLARLKLETKEIFQLPVDEHFEYIIPDMMAKFDEPNKQEVKSSFFQTGTNSTVSRITTDTSKSHSSTPSNDFLKGKNTIIRPIGWNRDAKGSLFIDALSHEFPMRRFKIYAHNEEECKRIMAGDRWNATIGGQHGLLVNCYKINILSLTPVETKNTIIKLPIIYKKDHHNRMINKEEFSDKYKECSFCSGDLSFDEEWKAMSDEHCICASCLADPEIVSYLPNLL